MMRAWSALSVSSLGRLPWRRAVFAVCQGLAPPV